MKSNRYLKYLAAMFFLIVMLSLASVPMSVKAQEQNWYVRPIIIDNTQNSNSLTDYQISFILNTASLIASNKMRADCGDIRIADSGKNASLNYWIEGGCNSATTKIWVKVPVIPPSSSKTIYLYYGNRSVTSLSSARDTFIVWDDFGPAPEQWTEVDSNNKITIDRNAGKIKVRDLRQNEEGYVVMEKTLEDFLMEFEVKPIDNYGYQSFVGVADIKSVGHDWRRYVKIHWGTPLFGDAFWLLSEIEQNRDKLKEMSLEKNYYFTLTRLGHRAWLKAFDDPSRTVLLWETNVTCSEEPFYFVYAVAGETAGDASLWASFDVDNIRIRKYTPLEPLVAVGNEEISSTPPPITLPLPPPLTLPTTTCTAGQTRCYQNNIQKCSSDGTKWEAYQSCDYGCETVAGTPRCKSAPVAGGKPVSKTGETGGINMGKFAGVLGIFAGVMIFLIILGLILYIYCALALMTIAKKTGTKNAWFAWLPILSTILMGNIVKAPVWQIIVALLVPFVNVVILIIWLMKIAELRGRPGWWGILIALIPIVNLIMLGILAWKDVEGKRETAPGGMVSQAPSTLTVPKAPGAKKKVHAPKQVVDYIKAARARGMKDNEIRKALIDVGWSSEQVDAGFNFT